MSEPTLFSQRRFVEAVVRSGVAGYRPANLGRLWAVHERKLARRYFLSPFGLYAAPQDSSCAAVGDVVAQLQRPHVSGFRWVVRYDHEWLAEELRRRGIRGVAANTHVLAVTSTYDQLFARFSETRRRQVRKARSEGVKVRRATSSQDAAAYVAIHRSLSDAKGRAADYPLSVFEGMLELDDTVLLLAERDNTLLGGAMFFRDGDSLFYWHGAADRTYSRLYPTCAIFDHAIGLACAEQRSTVNFGASLGISSLEEFKASWGASPRSYWKFEWNHPAWSIARRVRRRTRTLVGGLRTVFTPRDRDA